MKSTRPGTTEKKLTRWAVCFGGDDASKEEVHRKRGGKEYKVKEIM